MPVREVELDREEIKKIVKEVLFSEEIVLLLRERIGGEELYKEIVKRLENKVDRDELKEAINSLKELIFLLRDEMNKRFEQVDKRFEVMERQFDRMFKFMVLGFTILGLLIGLLKIF